MGADVNAEDTQGTTPLHEAILLGNALIVEYLLKNGANVHFKTKNGDCPLITAVHRDDPHIIRILLKCGAHLSSSDTKPVGEILEAAIRNGATSKLESLKLAGANLEIVDELQQTPLHKAILYNCPEVVQFLMAQGVDKTCKDILGYTPIDYAIKLNRDELANILIKL